MEFLPVEILSHIFSFLKVEDFLNVSGVCRTFEEIINSLFFLEKVRVKLTKFEDFKGLRKNYLNLKFEHLDDKQFKKCNDELKFMEKISSSVQQLKLDDVEISEPDVLTTVIMTFDNVTELHLEGIYVKKLLITSVKCVTLSNLKVLTFLYSTNQLLKMFASIKDQLKTFKLCLVPHDDEDTKNQNYQLVTGILHNNCSTLEKLNLYDVNFDDEFLDEVSQLNLRKLSKFSMSFNSHLPPESIGFKHFIEAHASTLQKFKTFDHINQQQLKVLIENAINLQNLNLIVCSFCDYENFPGFNNLKNLEKLKLQPTSCCNIGNTCYQTFVEDKILNHRNEVMKFVTIKSLLRISDEIIRKIVSSFPNLISLSLSTSSEVDLNHVNVLKGKLKLLRKLVLNDHKFIE